MSTPGAHGTWRTAAFGAAWLGEQSIPVPRELRTEIRRARLATLPNSWLLLLLAVFWGQAGGAMAMITAPRSWFLAWLIVDATIHGGRVALKIRSTGREVSTVYYAWIALDVAFFCGLAAGIVRLGATHSPLLVTLAVILGIGWMGYISSRYAAFPRIGIPILYLLGVATSAALFMQPGLEPLGVLAPGGAVAFHMLITQNHTILMTSLLAQQENLRLSLHDPLTGLPNRLYLRDRTARLADGSDLDIPPRLGVLCLDLDGFKPVNDRYGHAYGDLLLVTLAQRLMGCLREGDQVFRIGGDEFVILLFDADEETSAVTAERIIEACAQPFRLDPVVVEIGVSVGIAVYPDDDHDLDAVISIADSALYRAKHHAKGTWSRYDERHEDRYASLAE